MSVVVGIDPGGTTGLAYVTHTDGVGYHLHKHLGAQLTAAEVVDLLRGPWQPAGTDVWWIAAERFVVSRRAGRSATAGAGQRARDILGALEAAFPGRVKLRNAGAAKAWGTDDRVRAAGLWPAQGRPHTTDAVRHALMFQVANLGNPDPLSLAYGARP